MLAILAAQISVQERVLVGGNGENICFIANKCFKAQENIEKLITSGGEGDKGGNGG
ncbi:unnamed protein product, partial [Didymodactylos carnosus]